MLKITIIRTRAPVTKDLNRELQWVASSLGLFNLRDKDKSCFRIFLELLKSTKNEETLTSDELAERLQLSRGTVIHHLHKLEEAGIGLHEKKGYILRVNTLSALIDELEKDVQRTCETLKELAREIDKKMITK